MAIAVIDAPSVLHRTYHARVGWDSAEAVLEAASGVLTSVLARAGDADWSCDSVVVAFDDRATSARRETAAWYKAGRKPTPELLAAALESAPGLLGASGVAVALCPGWEADDACAAAVRAAAGERCVVVSSDRDLLGLVSSSTCVLSPAAGSSLAGPAEVLSRHGVAPGRYALYAATRGDPSDGVVGVPGLGPKRAAALWSRYASLEEVAGDPAGVEDVLGARLAGVLAEHLALVSSNLELCRLRSELEVPSPTAMPSCWQPVQGRLL